MHSADILGAIHLKAFRGPIQIWRIGITNDPEGARRYWLEVRNESTRHWSQWQAESLSEAKAIERHFVEKGMKPGSTGGEVVDGASWIYVF